jgi:hypothetical protein
MFFRAHSKFWLQLFIHKHLAAIALLMGFAQTLKFIAEAVFGIFALSTYLQADTQNGTF